MTYWGLDGERPVSIREIAEASGYSHRFIRIAVKRDHDALPCVLKGKRNIALIRPRVFHEWLEREEHRVKEAFT